jgi:hypothetical protein
MSLDLTKQRLQSAKLRIDNYIDQNLMIWATEEVLLPAQVDIANSISQKASEALSLEKSGYMKVDLKWDLRGENNEPIHFFLEFGTSPHIIRAKGKIFGGADALHWVGPSGRDVFAKIVRHPGSKKHVGLVQNIKNERMPNLKQRIISEVQNKMEIDSL